ncbi:MAG: hypothetical protein LC777_17700 [Actinobacteria bacterium]|nr:hypothetical protein [Actinomycetota bacterium]
MLVLGIAQGAENDALLGDHDRPNLAVSVAARNRGAVMAFPTTGAAAAGR